MKSQRLSALKIQIQMKMVPKSRLIHVCLLGLFSLIGISEEHLCIRYPPQRLRTGNEFLIDCYQEIPPCGGDVYKNLTWKTYTSPFQPGEIIKVNLTFPITHYEEGLKVYLNLSLAEESKADKVKSFKLLKSEMFTGSSNQTVSITIPASTKPGKYVLKADFSPPTYAFVACSDIEMKGGVVAAMPKEDSNKKLKANMPEKSKAKKKSPSKSTGFIIYPEINIFTLLAITGVLHFLHLDDLSAIF